MQARRRDGGPPQIGPTLTRERAQAWAPIAGASPSDGVTEVTASAGRAHPTAAGDPDRGHRPRPATGSNCPARRRVSPPRRSAALCGTGAALAGAEPRAWRWRRATCTPGAAHRRRHRAASGRDARAARPRPGGPRVLPRLAGCEWVVLGRPDRRRLSARHDPGAGRCRPPRAARRPGPVARGRAGAGAAAAESIADVVAGVTVLKLNEIEARALTGSRSRRAGDAECPRCCCPRARRARSRSLAARSPRCPLPPAGSTDPTGAGDSLCALYASAVPGHEPAAAVPFAVRGVERALQARSGRGRPW